MEKNFKDFVKKETRKEKLENISIFFSENGNIIWTCIYIGSLIFALTYAIWGTGLTQSETTIISINKKENIYVNSVDAKYVMTIKSNKDATISDVILSKDDYEKYSTSYNKGISKYLDNDYHIFYILCIIYLVINILILFTKV